MRLVEDDGGSFGENAGIGRIAGGEADRGVGEKEMVIDDDEVGFEGAAVAPLRGMCRWAKRYGKVVSADVLLPAKTSENS